LPVATPEQFVEMLDAAKREGYAYAAVNVSSSTTLNAALSRWFCRSALRRDRPADAQWCRIRVWERQGRGGGRKGDCRVRTRDRGIGYGVVEFNLDTDLQYAYTRAVADHTFRHYDGVLQTDGSLGDRLPTIRAHGVVRPKHRWRHELLRLA
jgi:hypothetical protein